MPYFPLARLGCLPLPFVGVFCGLLLATSSTALAQANAAVTGTVASQAGVAIEFATVTLHRAADSTVVKTEFCDEKGHFLFETVGGRYLISAAQVGFGRFWSPAFELTAPKLNLPAITLIASQATALKEVTVTARKPIYEHFADRTVVNVADSPLAASATTLDILARAPGVTVNASDNLGLRGRTGLLVVIDGKRVPLTGTELGDYLRALPAEQLQSIELITNPPVQYDAQGGAGVIAINLKKDQRLGTNGSVNTSYGRGRYGKFTGGLALNHRHKTFNAYGTYAYTERRGFVRLDFDRGYSATPQLAAAHSIIDNDQLTYLRSHSGKIGLDFTPSARTLVGVSVNGLASQTQTTTQNTTVVQSAAPEPTSRYTSAVAQDLNRPSGALNLNLRHTFADSATASALTADADYARYHTARLLELNTNFEQPTRPTTRLDGDQNSTLTIQSLKADFSQPLPHRARLEVGVKTTQVISDNSVVFMRTSEGTRTFDPLISNDFRYDENVNAAYVNLRGSVAKTTLQAGLRAEQTNTLAETEGGDSRERHYVQFFPNVLVQRALGKQHGLALSVARRIDRPSYGQVNPLRNYFDATSYRSGNPDLVAQTSYNFEVTHTYRQKFSTALSFAQTDNPIVNVVQPSPDGGRLVVNRDVNLSTQQYFALTITAPLEVAKWWTLYANGVLYYSRFRGSLAGTELDRGKPAFLFSANNSFSLPHAWTAELNGNYQSPEIWGFESARGRGQVTAGLQKSLWNKLGTIRLNVADIFYTTPIQSTSTYDNFTETFRSAQDTRVVTAAFTYRFGNSKVTAARKRTAGAEEELRRASGQ
ncbi:TonB-dependent receptor [Hymenobacter sp. BT683]|uniref:TonB-dependent receptor n=1 Tax=Hymenobacter jeongseonensis TaxID=2791027 RepID=A0ABS0IKW8_9BACT|nr:outer membrane beta-barrel protein [Hymenobacter jeongseonensis]MBF9239001.1 TonB-dependent receptor [Hymenobacter jeongseonensis]